MTDSTDLRFLRVSNDFSGDVLYPDEMEAVGYDHATIMCAWPGWVRGEDGYWHMPRPMLPAGKIEADRGILLILGGLVSFWTIVALIIWWARG
jgi:hypothetical protein